MCILYRLSSVLTTWQLSSNVQPFQWKKGDLEVFNPIKYTAKDLVNETKQEKLIKKIGESVLSLDKKQISKPLPLILNLNRRKEQQPSDLKKKKLSISNLRQTILGELYRWSQSFSDLKPTGNMLKSEWNPFVVDSGENPTEIHQIHWKTWSSIVAQTPLRKGVILLGRKKFWNQMPLENSCNLSKVSGKQKESCR